MQVIWEIEPGAQVIEKVALPKPTGFDDPKELDAFLDAVRWGAASSADVKSVQSPFRSGIDIEDYQLDPVVRAVQMPTKDGGERVEFAIKLPGRGDDKAEIVWLPIDAKFPIEDYQRLQDAQEKGDAEMAEAAAKQLGIVERIRG